jgi:hypothetical protein
MYGKLKLTPPMQVVCLQGWGTLQLAIARLRAHFFTPFKEAPRNPLITLDW